MAACTCQHGRLWYAFCLDCYTESVEPVYLYRLQQLSPEARASLSA